MYAQAYYIQVIKYNKCLLAHPIYKIIHQTSIHFTTVILLILRRQFIKIEMDLHCKFLFQNGHNLLLYPAFYISISFVL